MRIGCRTLRLAADQQSAATSGATVGWKPSKSIRNAHSSACRRSFLSPRELGRREQAGERPISGPSADAAGSTFRGMSQGQSTGGSAGIGRFRHSPSGAARPADIVSQRSDVGALSPDPSGIAFIDDEKIL
jgi:hypothetical protein